MKKSLALVLSAAMVFGMAVPAAAEEAKVYAVEAGSAGEEAAAEKGFEVNAVESQAAALMEVSAGTSDAAIIDLLMAGAMIGEGTSYPNLVHTDELTTEEYGIGCRKGSDFAKVLDLLMAKAYEDGTMQEIAKTYGVQEALIEQPAFDEEAREALIGELDPAGDTVSIITKGKLVVGITDFAPMDYKDENNEWIGFDADMGKLFAEELGIEIEFVEIDWDTKLMELEAGNIDCVWNGMTLTEEVKNSMECTGAYCNNAQVIVVPAE